MVNGHRSLKLPSNGYIFCELSEIGTLMLKLVLETSTLVLFPSVFN